MGVYIPPGFALSLQHFTVSGGEHPFQVGCGHDVPAGTPAPNVWADTIRDAWRDDVFNVSGAGALSQYTLTNCIVLYRVDAVTVLVGEAGGADVGTATGQPIPINGAFLIQKRTGVAGREHRGRMYLPPFSFDEAAIDAAGNIASTQYNALQTRINNWYVTLSTAELTPVLLHSSTSVVPTPITQLPVQQKLATQRRRMR